MTVWDELRIELMRLQQVQPRVLQSYPNLLDEGERPPPYSVTLMPSAVAAAEALYQRFGDHVELRVGALPFPPAPDTSIVSVQPDDAEPSPLPHGLTVELLAPLTVRSGEEAHVSLLVRNATGAPIVVATNGQLLARVVDPSTGKTVGGFSGFMTMPLVEFRVPDGGSVEIPLLVGTASFVQELGYTIPPGDWALTVDLSLSDGRKVRTPAMAFRVSG